jgi:hypothetical protein
MTQFPNIRVDGFLLDVRHWKTVEQFADHVRAYDPQQTLPFSRTAIGVVYHHTYRPLPEQWIGARSVESIARFYRRRWGWGAGPHLFIVHGSPDPNHDGIWQMTPLNERGIHAGSCNERHYGLEVVGDYDREPWPEPVERLAIGTGAVLLDWLSAPIDRQTVKGHRDCGSDKTCPGRAIDMDNVRQLLQSRLNRKNSVEAYTVDSPIMYGTAPGMSIEPYVAYLSRRSTAYDAESVRAICAAYRDTCGRVGVDWFLALAQVVHETAGLSSWWSRRPRRNPAGIGVTGETRQSRPKDGTWQYDDRFRIWRRGNAFAEWFNTTERTSAIEAHVGRLLAYALTDADTEHRVDLPEGIRIMRSEQRRLIAEALQVRPLPEEYRGVAPTIGGLSTRWAPGATYADRVVAIANEIGRLT